MRLDLPRLAWRAPGVRFGVPAALLLAVACGKSSSTDPATPAGMEGGDAGIGPGEGGSAGQVSQGGENGSGRGGVSGGDGGTSPSGGSPGQGGTGASSGTAGAPDGGGDGGTGGGDGATGGGGTGGGGPGNPCAMSAQAATRCPELAAVCGNGSLCCRCIDFPAVSCGLQWTCAVPANSPATCPPTPPTVGTECTALRTTCQYCVESGPRFLRCARESGADVALWSENPGLECMSGR